MCSLACGQQLSACICSEPAVERTAAWFGLEIGGQDGGGGADVIAVPPPPPHLGNLGGAESFEQ